MFQLDIEPLSIFFFQLAFQCQNILNLLENLFKQIRDLIKITRSIITFRLNWKGDGCLFNCCMIFFQVPTLHSSTTICRPPCCPGAAGVRLAGHCLTSSPYRAGAARATPDGPLPWRTQAGACPRALHSRCRSLPLLAHRSLSVSSLLLARPSCRDC